MFYDMTWLEKIIFLKQVIGGYSWQSDYETTPYLYRAMPNMSHYYNREIMDEVVGCSVAWNQLCDYMNYTTTSHGLTKTFITDSGRTRLHIEGTLAYSGDDHNIYSVINAFSAVNGHKYAVLVNGSDVFGAITYNGIPATYPYRPKLIEQATSTASNTNLALRPLVDEGTQINATLDINITDLTLALGSTIADYVYSLEQATAGSGVAWLKEHFPKMFQYNPYDAGSIQSVSGLVSHDTVGFNQFDKSTVADGYIDDANGTFVEMGGYKATFDYIKVVPSASYYVKTSQTNGLWGAWYDADKNFISGITNYNNAVKTAPNNANYARFTVLTSQSGNLDTFCINLSDASRNGQYEPYRKSSYPLDSTVTLRGKFKLDANNNLYADGDVYKSDGTVNRKYGIRAYQSGDESLADAVTDGTNTVYKLATPTTETAQPFTKTQLCDSGGTEEFVTSGIVSVGHKSKYAEK